MLVPQTEKLMGTALGYVLLIISINLTSNFQLTTKVIISCILCMEKVFHVITTFIPKFLAVKLWYTIT